MHSQRRQLGIALIFLVLFFSALAFSAEDNFSISIIGTTYYQDIVVIKEGLAKPEGKIEKIYPAQENRGFVILKGVYLGDLKDLLYDIRSLSVDRFAVEVLEQSSILSVNLRKIGSVAASVENHKTPSDN